MRNLMASTRPLPPALQVLLGFSAAALLALAGPGFQAEANAMGENPDWFWCSEEGAIFHRDYGPGTDPEELPGGPNYRVKAPTDIHHGQTLIGDDCVEWEDPSERHTKVTGED